MSLAVLKKKNKAQVKRTKNGIYSKHSVINVPSTIPNGLKNKQNLSLGCNISTNCCCNDNYSLNIKRSNKNATSYLSSIKCLTNYNNKIESFTNTQKENINLIKQKNLNCNNDCKFNNISRLPLCNPNYVKNCDKVITTQEYIEKKRCFDKK